MSKLTNLLIRRKLGYVIFISAHLTLIGALFGLNWSNPGWRLDLSDLFFGPLAVWAGWFYYVSRKDA